MIPKLWMIIPCRNEQAVIRLTMEALSQKLTGMMEQGLIDTGSRVMLVDDGSTDRTWYMIRQRCGEDSMFCGIRLSRNFGQQNALLAGMHYACGKCDCIISMDADLQDDIDALPEFVGKYRQGCHIVYGVRSDRSSDTAAKRVTAALFYKLMGWLGTQTVADHSECRLLSDKALHALQEYGEAEPFLRGIVPQLGFESGVVHYSRQHRAAGKTKYSARDLICLAVQGITASSAKPLRLSPMLGILCLGLGVVGLPYSGWICAGLQLLGLGIAGEYIRLILAQVRHRPRYSIADVVGHPPKSQYEQE